MAELSSTYEQLEGDSVYVSFKSLGELEKFWRENLHVYPYAAEGLGNKKARFLQLGHWIFSSSKSGLIQSVTRWTAKRIKCKWHDWAASSPEDHADFFLSRDKARDEAIATNSWSVEDQHRYEVDCTARSYANYRGWWRVIGANGAVLFEDCFEDSDDAELVDPTLCHEMVAHALREQIFNSWQSAGAVEVRVYDRLTLDDQLDAWRKSSITYYSTLPAMAMDITGCR